MAANILHRLKFLLFSDLFRGLLWSLLFRLQLEALRCSLELCLVHDEEVAGSTLGKVGLRKDVLHTSDGTYLSLIVDVFELVHFIGLINNPIALFKVNQLIFLAVLLKRIRGAIIIIIILRLIL